MTTPHQRRAAGHEPDENVADEGDHVPKTYDVTCEVDATATGKMRNEITTRMVSATGTETFTMATDEGPFHGGDSTAPPPLALFTGALTACLMTQMRAFAKRLDVQLDDLAVTGRARWRLHADGNAPYTTEPDGFDFDVHVTSPASDDQLLRLLAAAKKGCFIEQTLVRPNVLEHRLHVGGRRIAERAEDLTAMS